MSVVLQTGVIYYREDENDDWHPLIIKADTDLSSLVEEYDATATGKTWQTGELCLHDAKVYCANNNVVMPKVWTASDWSETTLGAQIGGVKNTLTQLKTDTFGSINLTGTNNTGSTITEGTFFYNNGSLVRAKTNIQNGSAITIGTNAETVTAGGLNALNISLTEIIDISSQFTINTTSGNGNISAFYNPASGIVHISGNFYSPQTVAYSYSFCSVSSAYRPSTACSIPAYVIMSDNTPAAQNVVVRSDNEGMMMLAGQWKCVYFSGAYKL